MDKLQTIPTRYAGITFRSRAEARWAMVFDALECPWSYETEGFQLETCWYLPDFWLSKLNAFAEVKGSMGQWDVLAECKASDLVKASQRPLLICADITTSLIVTALVPDFTVPWGYEGYECHLAQSSFRGHLWLEKERSSDTFGIDSALLHKLQAIRSHRFYAPR